LFDAKSTTKTIITRYAKRMLIENALADAVRFFHIDALSSSVGFKVDFDVALLVLASCLYRMMARRMRGYGVTRCTRTSSCKWNVVRSEPCRATTSWRLSSSPCTASGPVNRKQIGMW
jgi:hypothetical protein